MGKAPVGTALGMSGSTEHTGRVIQLQQGEAP